MFKFASFAVAAVALAPGCHHEEPAPAARPPDLAPSEVCKHEPPPGTVERTALDKSLSGVCQGLAAALGDGKPLALPADAPAQLAAARPRIEETAQPYLACRAVAVDADAACDPIVSVEVRKDCRLTRAFYHAARTAENPAWRMPDEWLAACRSGGMGAACDAYRDALRGRDASRCPSGAADLADCAALAKGDPARCPDERCKVRVRRYQALAAGGLARLASDGDPEDRTLAAAALGRKDACAALLDSFVQACRGVAGGPRDAGAR